MKAFTTDRTVRDYGSMAEFADHAAGKTDHLGNLPASSSSPGTWVRFAPAGTNLLGEDHTKVTMEHVAPAVGSTSFTYEPFATDDLSSRPTMKAAYETENADNFARFGVSMPPDKRQFGGESLFPKIAFAFVLLQPYVDGSGSLADLKAGQYVGQPLQRYLKIAWGYARRRRGRGRAAEAGEEPGAARARPARGRLLRDAGPIWTASSPACRWTATSGPCAGHRRRPAEAAVPEPARAGPSSPP